jgi:hypothetical protein
VVELAVKADDCTTPLASVESVSVFVLLLAKLPLAPEAGARNVTDAPLTGLLSLSTTVTVNAVPKAVPTAALCVAPAVAVIPAGDPAVFVRL